MVRAVKGVVIETEAAIKQILIELNNNLKFIISDLDETHLFVDSLLLPQVEEKLTTVLEDNNY
jgi:hypothetical protein